MKKALLFLVAIIAMASCSNNSEREIVYIYDTITVEKVVYKTTKKKIAKKKQVKKPVTKREVARAAYPFKVSQKGRDAIKKHEGLRLEVYPDSWGKSIGYGHFMGDGEPEYKKITKQKAEQLFDEDVMSVERSLNSLLAKKIDTKGYQFSQDFIDGLADLLYNSGHGNVEKSEVYVSLRDKVRWGRNQETVEKDIRFVASKVRNLYITCPGHVQRRLEESQLMASN